MAKLKNKKRFNSDHVHKKKEALRASKKTLNPFEIHVNKEKMRVLGQKLKNDRGLPGISRNKALQKRKHTLLKEYKLQNKSNKFTDKRIGEKNNNLTDEDKVMARFTAVRVKQHNRKSIFNLADDEVLTHRGQTLSEIEKFDDPRSDNESDLEENDSGKLDRDFVEDAHFGGGILTKTGNEGVKTHKELIEQLITESKKRKAEKQMLKEQTLELTEKLDTEWKDLLPIVSKSKKTGDDEIDNTKKVDDYDKVMRELRFEARGGVSDRLKTEDEVAKEEKEKLEKLEKERLERMKGFVDDDKPKGVHRSADDLDDDFVYESDPEYMLSYNQAGESNVDINTEVKLDENESEQESEGTDEEDSEDDDLSDLKAEESDDSGTEESQTCEDKVNPQIKEDVLKREEVPELPFTFALPTSYENLHDTLCNQPPHHQSVIIERMIKCNHPSLDKGNKENLSLLFAYLLQYLNDLPIDCKEIGECFTVFTTIVPQIYELAQLNEENAHKSIVEVIKEKHLEYRKKPKQYPGNEILIFLKLISLLFTTSDFRHQIVTPSFVFIEQMLTKCKVKNQRDISYGIFLTTLIAEYTFLSKRYLPAAINFLGGILHMAIPKSSVKLIKVLPPFKATCSDLVLTSDSSSYSDFKMNCKYLVETKDEIDDLFKIRALYTTLKLLQDFYENLQNLSSCVEIFEPISKYLQVIPIKNYPIEVQNVYNNLNKIITDNKNSRNLNYIEMEAKKPKALRLYEPKIVEVYDGKRYKVQSKEKAERDKLIHKLKKEKKGALREIRRDKSFLGRVKIGQKIQSDRERKEKVKRIYAEAAVQQHELNTIDRKKKRK